MSTKIDSLTSFRFLAALAIVLFHANSNFPLFKGTYLGIACQHGVSLFFVLSGFILTTVYFEQAFCEPKHWIAFLRKRIGRIWPLHVSALIFQVVVVPSSVALLTLGYVPVLLANIALLHTWLPLPKLPFYLNPPSWSVSTEWFFYLAFPLLLVGLRRSIFIPIAFACVGLATVGLAASIFNLPVAGNGGASLENVLYINPLARMPEFVAGMLTAVLFKRRLVNIKFDFLSATMVEVAAVAFALSLSLSSHAIARTLTDIGLAKPCVYWLKMAGIPLIVFAVLIGVFAMRRGGLSRILSAPYLVLLGEISYSTYLLHVPLLMWQNEYCPELASSGDFLIFLLILLLISHVFYSLIEKPMRDFIGGTRKLENPAPRPRSARVGFAISTRLLLVAECCALVVLCMTIPAMITQRNLLCDSDLQIAGERSIASSEKPGAFSEPSSGRKTAYVFETTDVPLTCKMILPAFKTGTIRFIWDAESEVRLDKYNVFLTLYDKKGAVISADTRPVSRFPKTLESGQLWQSMMYISELRSRRVKKVRFMVVSGKQDFMKIRSAYSTSPTEVVLSRKQLISPHSIALTDKPL